MLSNATQRNAVAREILEGTRKSTFQDRGRKAVEVVKNKKHRLGVDNSHWLKRSSKTVLLNLSYEATQGKSELRWAYRRCEIRRRKLVHKIPLFDELG